MIPQIIGALTQVLGQSEDKCGSQYEEGDEMDRGGAEEACEELDKINLDLDKAICSPTNGSAVGISPLAIVLNHVLIQKAIAETDISYDVWEQERLRTLGYSLVADTSINSLNCERLIRNIGEVLDLAVKAKEDVEKYGDGVCHCCMVPSVCLLGGVGRVIDLLRVGNYAGLIMGIQNNKICSAIQKTQRASMALDAISGGKCVAKGRSCKKTHNGCTEILRNIITQIEGEVDKCNTQRSVQVSCSGEIAELEEHIEDLEASSARKCGTASEAGKSQLMQSAMTGLASVVAGECKKDYEEDIRCDDKKDEELDECCERHPRADACKQDRCEGKQGAELDSCCEANPQSHLCRRRTNVCHPIQVTNDPTQCMERCRQDPTLPGCQNFCNLSWHKEICPEVCKTYEMPRCEGNPDTTGNACEANPDDPCCTDPDGVECENRCNENPELAVCRCRNNPGRCQCDRAEDRRYMSEEDCSTYIDSEDCEPGDLDCLLSGNDDGPGSTTGEDDGNPGGGGSPWADRYPFAGGGVPDSSKSNSTGATKYSAGGGPGGGGGGLGGGGLGGGSGGGGGSGEEGEGSGEEGDPYENILAGLSGSQNQGQGAGGFGRGRGSRARSKSGFDLKKFLPKKKKSKKAGKKNTDRVPSSTDNIFDLSSQMMDRYCKNNNINCVQK